MVNYVVAPTATASGLSRNPNGRATIVEGLNSWQSKLAEIRQLVAVSSRHKSAKLRLSSNQPLARLGSSHKMLSGGLIRGLSLLELMLGCV